MQSAGTIFYNLNIAKDRCVNMARKRIKANVHDLCAYGIGFFETKRVKFRHSVTGEIMYGTEYVCDKITQSQKDSLCKFKNVLIGEVFPLFAQEIRHTGIVIFDKAIPQT